MGMGLTLRKASQVPRVHFFPQYSGGIIFKPDMLQFSCLVHSGFNAEGNTLSQAPAWPAIHPRVLCKGTEAYRCPAVRTALPALTVSAGTGCPERGHQRLLWGTLSSLCLAPGSLLAVVGEPWSAGLLSRGRLL